MAKMIKNARQAVRRAYEVEYIPESESRPSPLDVLIQNLLNNRGKAYVLLTRGLRKKQSAYAFVRRLRRRAEEGQVGLLIQVFSKSYWNEGLVKVYGRALTDDQYKEVVDALDGKVGDQPANQLVKVAKMIHKQKETAAIRRQHGQREDEQRRDEDGGGGEGEG